MKSQTRRVGIAFLFACLTPILSFAADQDVSENDRLEASALNDTGSDNLSFLDGFTMVVLEDGDIPSLHEAKDFIHSRGGHVAIMSPPSLLLGWVPFERRTELIGRAGIKEVYFTDVLPGEVETKDEPTRAMVDYFNAVVRGEVAEEYRSFQETARSSSPNQDRLPDSFDPPEFDETVFVENLRSVGLDIQTLKDRGIYPEATTQSTLGNSDYMTGTIAVSIFFVESDGSGSDPDQYTWTAEDMQDYLNGVVTGLAWWSSRASYSPGCSATFLIYHYSGADPRCQQWVEPILHTTDYENTWVEAIMSNFGFTSGNMWTRVNAFNTWQRSTYQTARAYSAFIVYNPSPAPTFFPDGHTAYAWYYGPHTVLLFRLAGTSTAQVFAHESGHIFGACDEYAGGCSHCGECANGVDNGNCVVCSEHGTDCVMNENTLVLCPYTPGHVGWDGVVTPCTPTPPPPLSAPSVSASYPSEVYQGLSGTITIVGSNFHAGTWADLGPDVFIDRTTLVGAESLIVDLTALRTAPPGLYDVTVRNRDFQEATLPAALEVLATSRHYFSPTGGNQYPYLTPAGAATALDDAIAAGYSGDTLFVPTMTFSNFSLALETGVLLHGGWNNDFSVRDLESGKTVLLLNGSVNILPGATLGGLDGFILERSDNSAVRVWYETATIANCELRANAGSNGLSDGMGGAIWAEDATLDIRGNYMWDNSATLGGAIYLDNCSGSISDNTISENAVATFTLTPYGGGIYLVDCADVVLSGNTIDGNTGASDGGGVFVGNSLNVLFTGGLVSNNTASLMGGGVAAQHSQVDFSAVEFQGNTSALGGGIAATDTSAAIVSECRFLWNSALIGGGVYGAVGGAEISHNLFVGNAGTSTGGAFFLNDVAASGAPGSTTGQNLYTAGVVTGNTLDRNSSTSGVGGMSFSESDLEVFNNIVSNSLGSGISCAGSPSPTESYNLVWNSSGDDYDGCSPGVGSISADPLYVDTLSMDYHLAVHSPAIDAGRPGAADEDPDGSRGDMGWYGSHDFTMEQPSYPKNLTAEVEFGDVILSWDENPEGDLDTYAVYRDTSSGFVPTASNFVTFIPAGNTSANLGAPGDTAYFKISAVDTNAYAGGYSNEGSLYPVTGIAENVVRYQNRLFQNVPNPFNPVTLIRYELSAGAEVSLVIYDVAGRRVKRLKDETQVPGVYTATWNGTNDHGQRVSSGIYFYRLSAGTFVQTRKMVLLK